MTKFHAAKFYSILYLFVRKFTLFIPTCFYLCEVIFFCGFKSSNYIEVRNNYGIEKIYRSKSTKYQILKERDKKELAEEYLAHLKRKKEAHSKQTADKARCSTNNNFMSTTFDMQSVLQIPSSLASLLYCSCKLCVDNLWVYNLASPNDASSYCWSEVEEGRGSNEIATCLYD